MKITISREDGTSIVLDNAKETEVQGKLKIDPEKSVETNKKEEKKSEESKENLSLIDSIFANNLK